MLKYFEIYLRDQLLKKAKKFFKREKKENEVLVYICFKIKKFILMIIKNLKI